IPCLANLKIAEVRELQSLKLIALNKILPRPHPLCRIGLSTGSIVSGAQRGELSLPLCKLALVGEVDHCQKNAADHSGNECNDRERMRKKAAPANWSTGRRFANRGLRLRGRDVDRLRRRKHRY